MSSEDSRYTKNLGRNLAIGLVATYAATIGLCQAATGDVGQAAAIATVPALFAGPYVGLLITLISAVRPRPEEADVLVDASVVPLPDAA